MKHLALLLITFLLFATERGNAQSKFDRFQAEQYHYSIEYHWGFIWKKAAEATFALNTTYRGDTPLYKGTLVAKTMPFADRIFKVRDTLWVEMDTVQFRPLRYAKIANEDKVYRKDLHTYEYRADSTLNHVTLYRPHRNSVRSVTNSIPVSESGFDMMSVFFHMRVIDFANTPMHQRFEMKIFSGSKKEHLIIQYLGRTLYQPKEGRPIRAYKVALRFSMDRGTKQTDAMTALISEDERRYPLYMEGKLPLGSLKVFYIPAK